MRAPRFEATTAGSVLALSLALAMAPMTAYAQQADAGTPSAIENGVPMPDVTPLPPPTAADFGVKAAPLHAAAAPATNDSPTRGVDLVTPERSAADAAPAALSESEIERAIPVPEEAGVAPPTLKDIGAVPAAPIETAVADKLKEAITTRLEHLVSGKRERAAIENFYKDRRYAPLWIAGGAPNARMAAAVARLRDADADGLDASEYPTPDLKTLSHDPDALAQAELKLTNSALIYARQAEGGRVTPSRISPNIDFSVPTPDPAQVLKTLADAKDVASALNDFNPPHDGFRALKAKLAELRGRTAGDTVMASIPDGRALKRGMMDQRVPALRERLGLSADATNIEYDRELADAVKAFQRSKGLRADGVLRTSTVEAMNGRNRGHEVDVVISNMERWRWLPRDLGSAYVMVNIPDFTLKVVHDHKTVFHTRIVVGKPGTPSPNFSAAIDNILVNPSWHVPQSIIYKEYLPALQQDPSVLSRMGLTLKHERDGTISITQPPSERNALGRIKFNFPNKYQVYLHDTPDKRLFAQDRRAFSHGCMRVQNPTQFGETLLSLAQPPELRYSADHLQHMFGSNEAWLNFKKKIPVHLVYLNAYVDDAGKLVIRDDLYGYDARVRSALHGEYMAVSERSQKVTPGAAPHYDGPVRQAVRDPIPQQQRGFFLFPWFQ